MPGGFPAREEFGFPMAIRFAPARNRVSAAVARALTMPALGEPANDGGHLLARDQLLRKALLHFAEHGLAAAAQARGHAANALRRGDQYEFHNWLAICRLLDRRMANLARLRGFT